VLRDRRFEAIRAVFDSGIEPRPSLLDSQLVVAERYSDLGDRIGWRPEPPTLISRVQALSGRPVAIDPWREAR
jgi:hypothetical protein